MKKPWNEEEQKLFLEGLQMFGPKCKSLNFLFLLGLKEISDHVKTRTIVQVRSHL